MFYLLCDIGLFFFKQKTAYEMRISDWSSDVCSSDLLCQRRDRPALQEGRRAAEAQECRAQAGARRGATTHRRRAACDADNAGSRARVRAAYHLGPDVRWQGVSDLGVDRGCKRTVSCERRAGPFEPRHEARESVG